MRPGKPAARNVCTSANPSKPGIWWSVRTRSNPLVSAAMACKASWPPATASQAQPRLCKRRQRAVRINSSSSTQRMRRGFRTVAFGSVTGLKTWAFKPVQQTSSTAPTRTVAKRFCLCVVFMIASMVGVGYLKSGVGVRNKWQPAVCPERPQAGAPWSPSAWPPRQRRWRFP